ncbi:MAG TPA: IniB N-terminal domain-containing protein, partial [Pseudonocardiaceae bacterium]
MEQADQTLHNFVLNLLSDQSALASFEQDPAAVLDQAGLSDISAADVHEVIPLAIDFLPAHTQALDS